MSRTVSSDEPEGAIALGAFDLVEPLGAGGMGQVWRAVHRARGIPVAVKVLTHAAAREPRLRDAFVAEVRAVAALDHPNIVGVYDYGIVGERAAGLAGSRLVESSPYYVMEIADLGTLEDAALSSWPPVATLLSSILGALAHSHARGVLHRDLKPANVLVFRSAGGVTAPKLADFGLAYGLSSEQAEDRICGTPAFMAPEQVRGAWREFGPWTDLYALGCIAFHAVTGRAPYVASSIPELLFLHGTAPPPPLEPRFDVPVRLERWIHWLMAKRPDDRCARAADAARALAAVDDDGTILPARARTSQASIPLTGSAGSAPTIALAAAPTTSSSHPHALRFDLAPPSMPGDWRTADHDRARNLDDAGIGLYGLKAIPLFGREAERDRLWAALRSVREEQSARAIVIRGAAGVGKTHLAQWLCERAHELGLATPLKAIHGPTGGSADGLGRMFARHLRLTGLELPAVVARLRTLQAGASGDPMRDEEEALACAALCVSATPGEELLAHPIAELDKHARYSSLLSALARGRPIVLWLDDVQWGADALGLMEHILDAPDLPVLMLATVRDEALAERPHEAARLGKVLTSARAETLALAPLDREGREALVGALLPLEPAVAARVAERTAGNPLFAVQLVGDWVERRVLVPGPNGFRLDPRARDMLPDDLHVVWAARVERVLSSLPPSDRLALELAACLGQEIDIEEWRAACAQAGAMPSADLVTALLTQRLAVAGEDGAERSWALVHGMLRESILRLAEDAERARAHHHACAASLEERGLAHSAERIAQHRLAAGADELALEPLIRAAEQREARTDFHVALDHLRSWAEAADRANVAPDDARRYTAWIAESRALRRLTRPAEAEEVAARALTRARARGFAATAAAAAIAWARAVMDLGRTEDACRELETVRSVLAGDPSRLAAECLSTLGEALLRAGRFARAQVTLHDARTSYERVGDAHEAALCANLEALAAARLLQLDDAQRHAEHARAELTRLGARWDRMRTLNTLGEVARARGDFGAAAELYAAVLRDAKNLRDPNAVISEINLATTLVELGRLEEATALALEALAPVERWGRRDVLAATHAVLLRCHAVLGAWDRAEAHLARVEAILAATPMADADVARSLEHAARAADASDAAIASRCRALYRAQREALDASGSPSS